MNKEEKISILLDREVETYDGHQGIVIRDYISNNTRMVHIKQQDNKIWYCPLKDIKKVSNRNIYVDEIERLQSELETANNKLEEIKGYLLLRRDELEEYKKSVFNKEGLYNVNIEKFIKDILSIIGGD